VERADKPSEHSGDARSDPPAGQTGTLVQHGEHWTVGYGAASFPLRNALGLTYIQRLLQHPGEQFHALDLLTGTASSEILEADPSRLTRFHDAENLVVGRPGDSGPILDEQAKRDYRRRISELNDELNELRERGNLNLLGERDYQRRAELEFEIEALTRQLAQAVGIFGRDRRSGSAAERARLNVTRTIRSAIQRISERNAVLGELLGSCIRTGSFCSYVSDTRSSIDWRFALEGLTPTPVTDAPTFVSRASGADFIQPLRSTAAFVGREKERELLRRCLQEVKNGRGRIVVIAGPPGIGKTRTAGEAGNEARQQGFVALAGNCYDREDTVPFVPFVEVLEVVLARAPGPATIREILGDQAAELSRLLPQALRLFPDLPAPMRVSAQQSRRMLFNAIVDLFRRQSALNPLLLLLEDLHWADEGTLALLTHLALSISTMPLMIIATHRNDDIDMKPPLSKTLDELSRLLIVQQLPLGGLPEPAVARMIELLSGQEPSPALVELIYSDTDGNPLFVEELIRDLDQNQSNGDFVERLRQGEVALPHSLQLAIGRRLALVSKEAMRILGTAAVIGRSFNFGLLEAATRAEPDPLVDSLEEAEKAGLISSRLEYPEARFKFAHELIRRAVLDEISVARRQRLHLNIAEGMELLHANSLEEHAEDLAHHFWSAGAAADPAKAIRYLQMAGDKAARSSANLDAIDHFRKALQLIETLPETSQRTQQELTLQVALATPLMATRGQGAPEVGKLSASALALCRQLGETPQLFEALWGAWLFYLMQAEYQTARELAERLFPLAQCAEDPALLQEANFALAGVQYRLGELVSARAHYEQALALYDPRQSRPAIARYGWDTGVTRLPFLAQVLWLLGYPDQALARSRAALSLTQEIAHPYTSASVLLYDATLHGFLHDPRTVQQQAEVLSVLCNEQGLSSFWAQGLTWRGWALAEQGNAEDGIEQIQESLVAARATGAELFRPYRLALLAEAYGKTGQVDKGLAALAEALALVDKTGERVIEAELYRLKGQLTLQSQESFGQAPCKSQAEQNKSKDPNSQLRIPNPQTEAEACFLKAIETARKQQARSWELRATTSLARLLQSQSKNAEAHRRLAEIYGWFTEGFDTADLKEAKALLDELSD
jgi:predicted ATPase